MIDQFIKLQERVDDLERRFASSIRSGTVDSVDAKAGTVRLNIGQDSDGNKMLSPSIPYSQFAGALKVHSPPSAGQQMTMFSPSGDPRQASAVPMTWSNQNASPSSKGDENVITYGGFRITLDNGKLNVTKGAVSVDIADKVTIKGDVEIEGAFRVKGPAFEHNGKNVGEDHVHIRVMPGGGLSGPPQG